MKKNKRVTGQVIVSAPVSTTSIEATISDSALHATRQVFAQLGKALGAFGPFAPGPNMSFVQGGIKLDVLDAGKKQNADFEQAAFEEFVRRAHAMCSDALRAPDDTSGQLAGAAEAFAADEKRDVSAIKDLFTAITARPDTSLVSADGELIDLGVGGQPKDDQDPDMEIDVSRIRRVARIKTTQGEYDAPAELAEGLQVGEHIRFDGVDPPTGAAFIRADRIDAKIDPTGELFADSVAAEPVGNPDDRE